MSCVVPLRSMTHCMKAQRALEEAGIRAEIIKLDPGATRKGCSYGVAFPCPYRPSAEQVLAKKRISYHEMLMM